MPYVASFGFKYNGRILLPGQLLDFLDGVPGDAPLTSTRYLVRVSKREASRAKIHCDGCNRDFLGARPLEDHRRKRLCVDGEGNLIPDKELLEKVGLNRTDQQVIENLPDERRRELMGEGPPTIF